MPIRPTYPGAMWLDGNIDASTAAAVASLAVSVLAGGLAMAWRLGRLEQKVHDVQQDVAHINDAIDQEVRDRLAGMIRPRDRRPRDWKDR